jgi:hypothetical protein
MTPKPLFSSFEIFMMAFLVIMLTLWICANIKNRIRAREEDKTIKEYRKRHTVLRSIDPLDTVVSNKGNITHKN